MKEKLLDFLVTVVFYGSIVLIAAGVYFLNTFRWGF